MNDIFLDRQGKEHIKPADTKAVNRTSVDAFIVRDGKILLIREHLLKFWEIPGGGMEEGESVEEALTREILEETGYQITKIGHKIGEKLTQFYCEKRDAYYLNLSVFYETETSGEQDKSKIIQEEISDCEWFELKNLDISTIKPYHRDIVKNYLKGQQ